MSIYVILGQRGIVIPFTELAEAANEYAALEDKYLPAVLGEVPFDGLDVLAGNLSDLDDEDDE